jgi:hypothetical protein
VSPEDVDGLGLGLGLLEEGLGVGLVDDGVGVGLADDELALGLADDGAGVELADDAREVELAGADDAALALAAGLVVLADAAVSLAAQGFAAAGAALAGLASNTPARLAGMMTNPEITPTAWAVSRRLLMDPPSPRWSSLSGSRSLP